MTVGEIQFAPLVPISVILALGAAGAVLATIGLVRGGKGSLLRLAILGLLLLALADPHMVSEDRDAQSDIALVVLDRSSSQRTGDRRAQIKEAEEKISERLSNLPDLEVRTIEVADGGSEEAPGTRVFEALREAVAEIPRQRFAGALIVSDGQIHDLPPEIAEGALAGPVHGLLTGAPGERDRRLVIEQAPGYGIVGKEVEVTYRVEDNLSRARLGIAGRAQARVTIRVNGEERETAIVPVGQDQTVRLELEHTGPTLFEVGVAPVTGELSEVNNKALVRINGVRDRLRVLLVSGQPHPGERTWRNLLKSDPSVDLVHFTILRPPEKDDFTPLNELALIAFPTHELFQEQIGEFDLIVFDRYLVRGVLRDIYLGNIVKHVREGGALLMAVGPEFAGRRSLYRTPLADVLPAVPTGRVLEEGFHPDVSEAGARHPVTAPLAALRGARIEGAGAGAKPKPPPWGRWFRQIDTQPLDGDGVLTGNGGRPLLVLQRVGKGRVAQLLSDHIWLWARGFEGGGPESELLRRLAHWLMREPELDEEGLTANVKDGRLTIERRSLEETTARTVSVTSPSGQVQEVALAEAGPGRAEASVAAKELGLYRVSDGSHAALAAAGALNPLELADLRANPEALDKLAAATGGGVRWLRDGLPALRQVSAGRDTVGREWLGLKKNGAYVVTGVSEMPLLPGLLFVTLALAALMLAWWREGR